MHKLGQNSSGKANGPCKRQEPHGQPPAASCSGMINVQHLGAGAWGAYTAVFAVIVASAIAMDG